MAKPSKTGWRLVNPCFLRYKQVAWVKFCDGDAAKRLAAVEAQQHKIDEMLKELLK
jgi:hypothetical protein